MTTTRRTLVLCLLAVMVSGQQFSSRLSYNITEGQEPWTFVGNIAADTRLFSTTDGNNYRLIKFDLLKQGSMAARYFVVDEHDGIIRTNTSIDREAICEKGAECTLILNIAVFTKTSPEGPFEMFGSVEVVVRIIDVNDNAPVFPQKVVTLSVAENRPPPYTLKTSAATDADKTGENSDISYTLDDRSGIFSLDAVSGASGVTELTITVSEMLDRERVDSYYITIVASDRGTPRLSGSVLINVAVTDVNDNAPVFVQYNYSVNVMENASVRDPILTVSAVDNDANNNGRVLYKLSAMAGPDVVEYFQIGESDGKIYLIKPVDYERETKFQFPVEAWDRGDPAQSAVAYVTVNIVDVNDNAPQIILSLSPAGTDIVEHEPPGTQGKFLGHFSVSDLDSGANGQVVCEVEDRNFHLEQFPGQPNVYKILLTQSLDHEDQPSRQVNIRCRDGDKNPLIATASFEVKVVDINDNAPVFTQSTFSGTVLENEQAGANVMQMYSDVIAPTDGDVLKIVAEDLDDGDNGRVTYSILPNANFSIDSLTGTLSALVSFDREAQATYEFRVFAEDHGEPAHTSTATVVVNILDQNDHPPHFGQPVFYLQIEENLEPGSSVGHVVAIDEDIGSNAKMIYSIIRDDDSSRYFSVDRDSGVVTSNRMFDRETRDSYTFSVEVQNPSIPSYKDSAQVMVAVLDDNDHDPRIIHPSPANNTVTLPNNTTVGSMIVKIKAEDEDDPESTVFEYKIAEGDSDGLFQVIKVTGEMILAREIQPKHAKRHEVTLVVSDGGSHPRSATASLTINIPAEGMRAEASANILSEPNFIIIVIIVSVTIFAALLIVTAICFIFRRDRKRRAGRAQHRQVKDKMYQAAHWVSTHSLPLGDATGSSSGHETSRGSDSTGEKKCKKEVSFSLDDDLEKEGDPDTSGSLGSVFSSPTSTAPDNNNLKPPADGRFVFIGGKTSPASNFTSCYESSDNNPVYQNTPVAESEDHMHMQMERQGEDALSASSGETGTDSGRGGSEDEAHSNRGSSLEADSRSAYHSHPHPHPGSSLAGSSSSGFSSFMGSDRGRRKPSSLSSLPEEQHRQHHSNNNDSIDHPLHPHHNYFRSSSEQLPTHGLGYPAGCSRKYQLDNKDNYYSMNRTGDGPFRIRDAPPAKRTFHTFGPQYSQQSHPAWQRAKGLDGGWRSVTPTTSYATDDDDLTTTSGSYTLSPDDPPTDSDDLPFRQVHDIMV